MNKEMIKQLLRTYTEYLEQQGYIDDDWWAEGESPIDAFIKTNTEFIK